MSKALVIKNVDFSVNKVATVVFNDKPCTAVSFVHDAETISSLGTFTLSYTLTPADTTDSVMWSSSDSSVVSISSGVLTANGLGTANITITCGGCSATCAVTVDVVESLTYIVGTTNDVTLVSVSGNGTLIEGNSRSRGIAGKDVTENVFNNAIPYIHKAFNKDITAIKIPNNANYIHIAATEVYGGGNIIYFIDDDNTVIEGQYEYIQYSEQKILEYTSSGGVRSINEDVPIPSGAIGFFVQIRPNSSTTIGEITTESALKTYMEGTIGFSVSYS